MTENNPSLATACEAIAAQLKARKQTIAVAESSTGGLISASLLAVPGASAYYLGGTVIYTAQARRLLHGVNAADVADLKPLTEPMAGHFAQRAKDQFDATWAIAELGVAGPTPARYATVPGVSVIAVSGPVSKTLLLETGLTDREQNMWRFTAAALRLLEQAITHSDG